MGMAARKETTKKSYNRNLTEDVIWANVDDEADDISLVPLDPDEERRRPRLRETMIPLEVVFDDEQEEEVKPQFSIRHLMIAQAAIALLLGLMRLFAPGLFAGGLGIMAMVFAALLSFYEPDDKRIHHAWWAFFAIYLLSCIFALLLS